ncbi:hypothetical protein CWB96_04880 [Pseudoalteromonas citrea]|uniref:ABC transporter permease n=1 Tax=Pseudoalteromonas citrea TaxID=43655 RepID=A0A5S3XU51_9GAMM|nr:ABC transporter permease [Pseudoalteromonas citrea]TMP44712.1 hypothetical protein CWB97_05745 [Pseudoalteromonas citrea]TMP61086.1 hypothetical protein CWB96_04880 [Pseudoalteromonas citrea]
MKIASHFKQVTSGLQKTPGFTLIMVFTLALTLGALLAAFNLNQVVLLKPLPYQDAQQLYVLKQNLHQNGVDNIGGQGEGGQIAMYQASKAAGYESTMLTQRRGRITSRADKPVEVAMYVSHEYFPLLGANLILGRNFTPTEKITNALPEAIISYGMWQSDFAADERVIGKSLAFNGVSLQIVGVIHDDFRDPEPLSFYGTSRLYLPMAQAGISENEFRNASRNLVTIQKNDPLKHISELTGLLDSALKNAVANSDFAVDFKDYEYRAHLEPLPAVIKGDNPIISLMVLAGAIVLLLIAFANIVNLYLSHVIKKQSMLAISASVGAKPKHIFKHLFVESLLITLSATAFGLLLAAWLLVLTQHLAQGSINRLDELGINSITVLFAVGIAFVLSFILAWVGSKSIDHEQLKQQLTSSGKGTQKQISATLRKALVISQVALTGLMLFATSTVLQSTLKMATKALGLNVENIYSLQIEAGDNYPSREAKLVLIEQLKQHFLALPEVEAAIKSTISPIRKGDFSSPFTDSQGERLGLFGFNTVGLDYFSVLEQPVLYGRTFTQADIEDKAKVMLVSRAVALEAFGKENAVGESMFFSPEQGFKIVGVVDDHYNAFTESKYQGVTYFAMSPMRLNLMVKVSDKASFTQTDIVREVERVDASLAILEFLDVEQTSQDLVFKYRLAAWLSGCLSVLALFLACAGIYGVVSYGTQMRRFELGVRMAVGAKPKRIIKLVVTDAFIPLLIGIGVSLLIAAGVYHYAYQYSNLIPAPDPLQVTMSLILLLGFSYMACIIPVKQILKSDLVAALRNQ